jgi:hypothetical protein
MELVPYLISVTLATGNMPSYLRKNTKEARKYFEIDLKYSVCLKIRDAPGGTVCLTTKMVTSLRDYARNYFNSNGRPIEVLSFTLFLENKHIRSYE